MALFIAAFILPILLGILYLKDVGRRPKGLPPGPPTIPLIGNLHQMPSTAAHIQFQKWADEYGPIYSLILGTRIIIVLSSGQAVKDLLDKRSAIYSSRPHMFVSQTLISGGMRMVLMQYSPAWRRIRKMFHGLLNITAAKTYLPYQDLETKQMLTAFLEQPSEYFHHVRRFTNSLGTQIVFGFRVVNNDNPRLRDFFKGIEEWGRLTATQTAAFLDIFPILQRLPGFLVPMRRYAESLHVREKALYLSFWTEVKDKLKLGTARPCFCTGLANAQQVEGFSDEQAAYMSGGAVFEAAADTTANTLLAFLLAMVLHPDVQRKAQSYIDDVCGDRMPEWTDEPGLQYIRGILKETMRWMPTAILGFPHCVTENDEYMGYRIPKGATIVMNVWTINRDPVRYPNPDDFEPSRYADDYQTFSEAALNPDVSKRDHFGFGAGRRVCQGMHIAERSLFLSISRLLWAFQFDKAVDSKGSQITPDKTDMTDGVLVIPRLFPMQVTPRSAAHATAIRDAWADCQSLLDEEQQWKEVPAGMAFVKYEGKVEE